VRLFQFPSSIGTICRSLAGPNAGFRQLCFSTSLRKLLRKEIRAPPLPESLVPSSRIHIRILYAWLFEARIFRSQVLTPHDAEISRLVAEAFPEYSVISRIGPIESQAQRNIFVSPQVLAPSIHSIPSHQNSHIDYFTPLLSLLRSLICFTSPLSLSFAHCQLTILFISCYLEYSHSR